MPSPQNIRVLLAELLHFSWLWPLSIYFDDPTARDLLVGIIDIFGPFCDQRLL